MTYHLFIDECGDAFLPVIDPNFPIFTLCGVVMSDEQLRSIESEVESLKREFWGEKKIILHSRDIRKHQKGFEILFDDEVKKRFYLRLNELISLEPDFANPAYDVIAPKIYQFKVFPQQPGE